MAASVVLGPLLLGAALAAAPSPSATVPAAPSATPAVSVDEGGPVILFLVDNSASLPPLDPEEKRVAALEKMFTFLVGRPYRLILFGGRHEIFVDDISQYRNNGQWTDFYFAFQRARDLMREYPEGTEFRLVLVTDAILDPGPRDWVDQDLPPGYELRMWSAERTIELLEEMDTPLYVILIGAPPEGAPDHPERAPGLILRMVQAANGAKATPLAQSVAGFFKDDGLLLKKFIFRVQPYEGLKAIQPIVARITAPASAVEVEALGALVLPLVLFLCLLLGILVRTFPGPGDVEVVEMSRDVPVHVAVDRMHRMEGGWATSGLSLVGDHKDAAATFTYSAPDRYLTGLGVETTGADPATLRLLPLPVDELRRALDDLSARGTKDERIFALNLDYMAKNLSPAEAERILTAAPDDRSSIAAIDFLRAKVHLISDEALRKRLLDPRVTVSTYGKGGSVADLRAGAPVQIGPYRFLAQDVAKGGRKDVRLFLHYDRVPSLLGLKNWLPDRFQRMFRFRRSSHRLVS